MVGARVQGAGCRVQGAGCRVQGAGCRVQGGAGHACPISGHPVLPRIMNQAIHPTTIHPTWIAGVAGVPLALSSASIPSHHSPHLTPLLHPHPLPPPFPSQAAADFVVGFLPPPSRPPPPFAAPLHAPTHTPLLLHLPTPPHALAPPTARRRLRRRFPSPERRRLRHAGWRAGLWLVLDIQATRQPMKRLMKPALATRLDIQAFRH